MGFSCWISLKRDLTPPRFEGPVGLKPMAKSQATLELLRQYKGGPQSSLLREDFGGSTSRMFMELARVIQSANCWRLPVGPLADMAEAVDSLFAQD